MKIKTILTLLIFLTCGFVSSAQAPARLFDVRNGNGIVDGGTVQPVATFIVFKDTAAKQKVIDSFAYIYGYVANVPNPDFDPKKAIDPVTNPQLVPNPQSKQSFFNQQILKFLRQTVKMADVDLAIKAAEADTNNALDAILPP
jgi:hypothetical protein